MEVYNKRLLMIFSIAQFVLSVIFFTLGVVDGFQIRFGLVSLLFTPCWIAALVSALIRKPMKSRVLSGPLSFLSDYFQLCHLIRVWHPKMRSHSHERCLLVSLRNYRLFNTF